MNNTRTHDVVIVGGGPGGSTLGAILARNGVDVALIEKETFPRFKIGESLLPYSMDILRKSGAFEKVDSGQFMRKYGAQFVDYNHPGEIYFEFQHSLDRNHPFAFQVIRADFDKVLLDHATSCGVTLYQPESAERILEHDDHVEIKTNTGTIRTKYIADASGRSALFGNQNSIRTRNKEFNNVAVFSHFENIPRASDSRQGDIVIGILPNKVWSWMIPFVGPVTSAGVVVDAMTYKGTNFDEGFIRECMSAHPKLHAMMKDAKMLRPTQTASNYSEKCSQMTGPRWILVGDAATFLDPVFSTGVHVAFQSADFASDILLKSLKENKLITETSLGQTYQERVTLGVTRLRSLLRLFYDTDFFPSMRKGMERKNIMQSFTSVVGGDAWNDSNELFIMKVL